MSSHASIAGSVQDVTRTFCRERPRRIRWLWGEWLACGVEHFDAEVAAARLRGVALARHVALADVLRQRRRRQLRVVVAFFAVLHADGDVGHLAQVRKVLRNQARADLLCKSVAAVAHLMGKNAVLGVVREAPERLHHCAFWHIGW